MNFYRLDEKMGGMINRSVLWGMIFFIGLGWIPICNAEALNARDGYLDQYPIFSTAEKSKDYSQTDEYKRLKEELKRLMEEVKRLEKNVKDKFNKEILSFLRREVEKLKKRLREFQLKDDDGEPKKI